MTYANYLKFYLKLSWLRFGCIFIILLVCAQVNSCKRCKFHKKGKSKMKRITAICDDEKEISEIIPDDNFETIREVHYIKEAAYSDCSNEEDLQIDTLDILDTNFELAYCEKCSKSWKMDNSMSDLKCPDCLERVQYQCARCSKKYKHIKSLRYHLRHHCMKDPGYHCADCDYKTNRKASLLLHVKCKHTKFEKRHKCGKCGKPYKHRFHMLGHERYCGLASIKCDLCPFQTSRPGNMQMHVRNLHTSADQIKFHHCSKCGKPYKHAATLYKHRKNCGRVFGNMYCAHCDFTTVLKPTLYAHLKKAHGTGLFPKDPQETKPTKRKTALPKRYTE